jgi:alkanesulfonate monooxygenase SsuD/methylene tetrahydromethanopterin reductase-like flavin-dependent oxidoreductase (luciferase family)
MPDIAIMVEGQHGVNWANWRPFATAVEDLGFGGLFRSDHFTNPDGPYRDALALWPSLTWLADHTDSIDFGPLVTPMSFRHPVFAARTGKDVDALAGGRLVLGLGAGWQEREHETFGFDLLPVDERFDRFEEGVEVVASLLRADGPVSFDGDHYQIDGAELHPRPGGTRLAVGGNGRRRTMPLAAAYADEWNAVLSTPDAVAALNDRFDGLLREAGRDPDAVTRSMMTPVVFGRDGAEVDRVLDEQRDGADADDLRERGGVVGTEADVLDHLARLDDAGLDRVMLQWLALEELDRLEAFADAVL